MPEYPTLPDAIVDYDVPFYANTPDDKHCAQATLRSARKYFEPASDFTWEELDEATGKVPGKGTWRMAGMMWLRLAGYDVHNVSMIDYQAFADHGLVYWAEEFGAEAAAWEERECDIPKERERAREFVHTIDSELRIPEQSDIEMYLDRGYLVQVTVNARRLDNLSGFHGHAILVKGYDAEQFIAHDPGLPARPNRLIPRAVFEAAWSNGLPRFKALTAMRFENASSLSK